MLNRDRKARMKITLSFKFRLVDVGIALVMWVVFESVRSDLWTHYQCMHATIDLKFVYSGFQ